MCRLLFEIQTKVTNTGKHTHAFEPLRLNWLSVYSTRDKFSNQFEAVILRLKLTQSFNNKQRRNLRLIEIESAEWTNAEAFESKFTCSAFRKGSRTRLTCFFVLHRWNALVQTNSILIRIPLIESSFCHRHFSIILFSYEKLMNQFRMRALMRCWRMISTRLFSAYRN